MANEQQAKHTPGPWVVDDEGAVIAENRVLAVVKGAPTYASRTVDWDRLFADAVLIAAAPELLEACKAQHQAIDSLMARLIGLDPTFRPTKDAHWPALVAGNAAIAKATGEQQ